MEVARGVLQFPLAIPSFPDYVNCYLIEGANGWLMVDCGWDSEAAFEELSRSLQDEGIALRDIATIVCTHLHPDHGGLAGRISRASPRTQVWAHRWEWAIHDARSGAPTTFTEELNVRWRAHGCPSSDVQGVQDIASLVLSAVPGALPVRALYGGEIISTGRHDIEIIWTPGHSPGHVCLYVPGEGWLFTGDHVLATTLPEVGFHAQGGDDPLGDYMRSVRRLQQLKVAHVFPGHEQCFTAFSDRVDQILAAHEHRQGEILNVMDGESRCAYEIAKQLTLDGNGQAWDDFTPLRKGVNVAGVIALLQRMRWEGQLIEVNQDGRIFFKRSHLNGCDSPDYADGWRA